MTEIKTQASKELLCPYKQTPSRRQVGENIVCSVYNHIRGIGRRVAKYIRTVQRLMR